MLAIQWDQTHNCFCGGCLFHFIKEEKMHHPSTLFLPSTVFFLLVIQPRQGNTGYIVQKHVVVTVFYISLLHTLLDILHSLCIFPWCGLSEQQSMIECALGQEWVALFQPKWGYLYNMSCDEAGTAACGIPYPELPFQGRNCTLLPFTLFPEPPKFTFQRHFPDSKSRPDRYQVVNNF